VSHATKQIAGETDLLHQADVKAAVADAYLALKAAGRL